MADEGKAGQSGVAGKALAVMARGQKLVQELPPRKRTGLLAGVLMLLAVIAGMVWFFNRTEWKVLYTGLEPRDSATVQQDLGADSIPFRTTDGDSGIEVPSEQLDKARMAIATKGMPQTGRLGFELFDKPNWVGSEFDEKVNYQRALEGELEHTIGSLQSVKSARVHLVLPAASLFSQEQKVAKASVLLKLRGERLTQQEADSMRRLVAGAVENLTPENVTLVDADGRLNLNAKDQGNPEGDAEQAMESKLVAMLEPTAGSGNVRAVVKATYDQADEERNDEVYDPTLSAPLSMEKKEQSGGGPPKPSGVPGTASNAPAAAPVGAVQGSTAAAAPGVPPLLQQSTTAALPVYPDRGFGQNQTIKEENETYAVTRHTVHREQGPGRLSRLTVAVVVNDRMAVEGAGKQMHTVWKPRSTEEMRRLEQLAQAAVGFDERRGDSVVVENVSFSSNAGDARPVYEKVLSEAREFIQEEPGAARAVVMGLVGILVVFLVLRPVARQVISALEEPKPLPEPAFQAALADGGLDSLMEASRDAAQAHALSEQEKERALVEQVAEHINRKPAQSSKLLENWINGPQETS
jgi:flagellar M-ring protein FliF